MSIVPSFTNSNLSTLNLPPLPLTRPLLLIGHGTKDPIGRENFINFALNYEKIDKSRPVIPCFLELTTPNIQTGIDKCLFQGYTEFSVLPILLFAARHNKFDITNELDRAREKNPQLKFHYGRHFGINPHILDLWRERLAQLDSPISNPHHIPRSETVLLFVGRGSSDPDANSDVTKMARLLWEGSGYQTVETCFIGITHPRLTEGFRRAKLYQPRRIIVLPYFLFTGVLVKKIFDISTQQQKDNPHILINCLPEMGIHPKLFQVLREREIETQLEQVTMNCEMCKFRLTANNNSSHQHHHHHHHHPQTDPYQHPQAYHQRIWQTP